MKARDIKPGMVIAWNERGLPRAKKISQAHIGGRVVRVVAQPDEPGLNFDVDFDVDNVTPVPDEPKNIGAVVRVGDEDLYVRMCINGVFVWYNADHGIFPWYNLTLRGTVTVLHEGYSGRG